MGIFLKLLKKITQGGGKIAPGGGNFAPPRGEITPPGGKFGTSLDCKSKIFEIRIFLHS